MKHLTSLITSLVLALAPAGVGAEEHSTTQQAALQYTKSPNRHFSRVFMQTNQIYSHIFKLLARTNLL